MSPLEHLIIPDWPAPANVRALQTTRLGGSSVAPYASLNLGDHVGDAPLSVARNRMLLNSLLPSEPVWLEQNHGTIVVNADKADCLPHADACIARHRDAVCVVMTADCLPILLCDAQGSVVGVAHAGWKGLAAGVIEATVQAMQVAPKNIMAWLGPARRCRWRQKISWRGWARPSARVPLKWVRKCAPRLLPRSRKLLRRLFRERKASGLPISTSWRVCVSTRWVLPEYMAGVSALIKTGNDFSHTGETGLPDGWGHSSGWNSRGGPPNFVIIRARNFPYCPRERFVVDHHCQHFWRRTERVMCRPVCIECTRALGKLAGQLRHRRPAGCGISRNIARGAEDEHQCFGGQRCGAGGHIAVLHAGKTAVVAALPP